MSSASLVEGSVGGHILRMSPPMAYALVAMMAVDVTDAWFVSMLGETELAALSFTFPAAMVAVAIGIGVMVGTSVVVARALGAGDTDSARRIARAALMLALLVAGVVAVVGRVTLAPLFEALGARPDSTLPLTLEYTYVWLLGVPAMLGSMAVNGAIRSTGDTQTPGRVLAAGALVNLVLDPLLIFGLGPVPAMGLAGAAAASVTARYAVLAVMLLYALKRHKLLEPPATGQGSVIKAWGAIGAIALPASLSNLVNPIAAGVLTAIVARFGDKAVAGYGAAVRVESLSMVLFFALSAVIGPVVAQNLAAHRSERARAAVRFSNRACLLVGLVTAILMFASAGHIAALFSDDPQVQAVTALYLRVVPLSAGLAGVVMVVNAAFNASGRPLQALVLSVLRMFVFAVPAAMALSAVMGTSGVIVAVAASNVLAGLIAVAWYRRGA